jgi:hypothetical protein
VPTQFSTNEVENEDLIEIANDHGEPSRVLRSCCYSGAEASARHLLGGPLDRHLGRWPPLKNGAIRAIHASEARMTETAQKSPMEDEKIDEGDVWSAIRYLDPDEQRTEREAITATIFTIVALLFILGGVWVLLWLRIG